MKYETKDGKIIDTESNLTILRFLRVGDRFKTKSSKDVFEVIDDRCNFNAKAGSPTRKCRNITKGGTEHKFCKTSVRIITAHLLKKPQ